MTIDDAYTRLVGANPVPDVERYMSQMIDLDAALRDYEEVLMDTKTHEAREVAIQSPPQRRRWRVAIAAFVAVLAIGGVLLLVPFGSGSDVVGDEPIDVVEAYFDRWNAGDINAALALLSPDVSINGGLQGIEDVRPVMDFAVEFDGDMVVSCEPALIDTQATCLWDFTTAGVAALGIEPRRRTFTVEGGLITAFSTPDFGRFDAGIAEFAESVDPAAFEANCAPVEGDHLSQAGFAHTSKCGAHLAQIEADWVASLAG